MVINIRTISQDVYGNEFWGGSPKEIWTYLKFESKFVDNECCEQRGFIQYVSSNGHGFVQFSGFVQKTEPIGHTCRGCQKMCTQDWICHLMKGDCHPEINW